MDAKAARQALSELALDLRWSWNHAASAVWARLDKEQWENTRNPWAVLKATSEEALASALAEPAFSEKFERLLQSWRLRLASPPWYESSHPELKAMSVAYFSMEFMLSEALPIYSGGLGNVAGDQLKAASDLGVPVVGVGLLYQRGYFRQQIGQDETQQALYPFNDPDQLPLVLVRDSRGEPLRIELDLPGNPLWLRAWEVRVGRRRLYLLDTNDPANSPTRRAIASELYGGGPEMRLLQEIVLGIGGWRLLSALGIRPDVCHLNEGHAAFVVLERARCFMEEFGLGFEAALLATRAGNLFTTHTAVAAGFDRFSPDLVRHYLGPYVRERLGLSESQLLALGRHDGEGEDFNMAFLAARGSGAINAVSRLHQSVSRQIFSPLFPRWPEAEVPIGHVTNGIHVPTWVSANADELWLSAAGPSPWAGNMEDVGERIRRVPAARLWQMRCASRAALVDYARRRLARQLGVAGAEISEVESASRYLDPNVLTLGFARRFAGYKRPNLLLRDQDRLLRLLSDAAKPVQLLIAGKAHPADREGQAMITQWLHFIRHTPARGRAVYLSDYDMLQASQLVQGVDLWLNTPRRPWEACGTSGMKVLANGGLNLSELDGWWVEAFRPEVGWALGDGKDRGEDPAWDAAEAEALFDLLEQQVVPCFYDRDSQGIPQGWIARMRESMAELTPRYSANRAVRDYAEKYYLPAADTFRLRSRDRGARAAQLAASRRQWESHGSEIRFGATTVATSEGMHHFEVQIYLGALDPSLVRAELYADPSGRTGVFRQPLTRLRPLVGALGGYIYAGTAPASRPASDYTPRAVPELPGLDSPLESPWIVWAR